LIFEKIQLEDWQIAFVSSINGGISTKHGKAGKSLMLTKLNMAKYAITKT